jgi:hypothetical protein
MTGRRLLTLLVVLAGVAIPAGVLQALCVGRSCDEAEAPAARVPFCTLPATIREAIAAGYREERSPDVLGVANTTPIFTEVGGTGGRAPWPAIEPAPDTRVPIVLAGAGIAAGETIPDGTGLDRIAPTIAEAIGLDRPHAGVRSGTPIEGVVERGRPPELVLLVAWKWTGSREIASSPDASAWLTALARDGAGTLEGDVGSLPLDPTATLSTIGTGGLPSQHGVTGSFVRDDAGEVVPAFGEDGPIPVIASLADDLDESTGQRSRVALVASDELDLGLIGVGWAYDGADEDEIVVADGREAVDAARSFLDEIAVGDGVTDLLAVVIDRGASRAAEQTDAVLAAARAATGDSVLVVVAGTGSSVAAMIARSDVDLVAAVETAVPGADAVVAATVPGGLFLDRTVLTEAAVTGQAAVDALLRVSTSDREAMMADAFQGFAVSFARYC